MQDTIVIDGEISLLQVIDGDADLILATDGECGIFMPILPASYSGPTEITPGEEIQVLSTALKITPENIIINPIPSNYGLITWNGTGLRIS